MKVHGHATSGGLNRYNRRVCGIAGYIAPKGAPGWGSIAAKMAARMRHRGPDDEGVFADGHVGLAHARLSILDRSEAGHQPMHAGGTHLTINGEIYNHRELANRFQVTEALRSGSDSEVLLRLIDTIGVERTLECIDGMYAFAAYAPADHALHLVRDPFGVKPLFVLQHEGALWFASEITALLEVPGFVPRPSPDALHHFLSLDYIPGSLTAFDGIEEVRPGAWWTIDVRTGAITKRSHAETRRR